MVYLPGGHPVPAVMLSAVMLSAVTLSAAMVSTAHGSVALLLFEVKLLLFEANVLLFKALDDLGGHFSHSGSEVAEPATLVNLPGGHLVWAVHWEAVIEVVD